MREPSEIFEVGTKVSKLSGKTFKSGFAVNTIKGVVEHPNKINPETNVGVPAYTFFEDDSVVEAAACTKIFTQYTTPKYIYIGDIKETQGKRCDCYYAREGKNGWCVLFNNISSDDYANAASWLSQKIKNNTDGNGFKNVWLVTGDAIGVCYGGYQLANIVPIKNLSEQMEFC